jgi:hypothetical protein
LPILSLRYRLFLSGKSFNAYASAAPEERPCGSGMGVCPRDDLTVTTPFDKLYATLDTEQQAAIDKLIQRRGRR